MGSVRLGRRSASVAAGVCGRPKRIRARRFTAGILALQAWLKESTTSEQFCNQLAKIFQVPQTEVAAFMRFQWGCLQLFFPRSSRPRGSIAVSSSSSIAAHTATSKKAEFYNNFSRVKHAQSFRNRETGQPGRKSPPFTNPPIQKLVSAPVLDKAGNVIGAAAGLPARDMT